LFCHPPIDLGFLQAASLGQIQYGAHPRADGGVDFGLHAPTAEAVELLLYDAPDALTPARVLSMQRNAAGDWGLSTRGPGIGPGTLYLYRLTGHGTATAARPFGTVLNGNFVLNDPYAYRTQEVGYSRVYTSIPFVDTQVSLYAGGGKSIVYDHAADPPLDHVILRPEDLIVYELHVQDYTARLASLAPELRGTYLGLVQPGLRTPGGLAAGIDHIAELGVTAVELMPVAQYDMETAHTRDRLNHWGYESTNFSAPEARYAVTPGAQVVELKRLVQAFHARGIAVFLDVVFNHTAESAWVKDGRLAFKCYNLCDDVPEIYRADAAGGFANDSGTGNDLDFSGDDRFTKQLVRDSLALWYQAYGIDGFRFDEALLLAIGSKDAARWVSDDPRYAAAHLHAELWDHPQQWYEFMDSPPYDWRNNRWAKWLGRYRDAARRFSKSDLRDPVTLKHLIEGRDAVSGSEAPASSKPWRSIAFVTIHDGYTLRDCTVFDDSDGSHNCWSSGNDEDLRRRREKLLLGLLLTSAGVPLLQQGDEFGRSKSGAGQEVARNSWEWESASGDTSVNIINWIDDEHPKNLGRQRPQ
jgi:isoamylase